MSLATVVSKNVGNDTHPDIVTDSEAGSKVILKTLGVNDTITDAERWWALFLMSSKVEEGLGTI